MADEELEAVGAFAAASEHGCWYCKRPLLWYREADGVIWGYCVECSQVVSRLVGANIAHLAGCDCCGDLTEAAEDWRQRIPSSLGDF